MQYIIYFIKTSKSSEFFAISLIELFQGENEYLDAVLLREGLNGQVEPKKKPMQVKLKIIKSN
jgi:hypothetical protein